MLPVSKVPTAGENFWVLGYTSDVAASTASIVSQASISECYPCGVQSLSGAATVNTAAYYPCSSVNLTGRDLIRDGSLKWWKVVGDSGTNNWENYQGMLLVYNPDSTSTTYNMVLHYTIEFGSPIPTILT